MNDADIYLAGMGHSDGGYYGIEVFRDLEDAKEYAESHFNFTEDREWTEEPNIAQNHGDGSLYVDGTTLYFGFKQEWKGVVMAKQIHDRPLSEVDTKEEQ